MASMLSDPKAPGRDYVLHATDETVTEFAIEPYAAEAPLHVVALRTPQAKYATYSNFAPGSLNAEIAGRETELYDYSTPEGRMELPNEADNSALEPHLNALMQRAVRDELHESLPQRLHRARRHGLRDYFRTASRAAEKATERRRERAEREFEEEAPFSEEPDFSGSEANATSLRRGKGRRSARRRHGPRAG